MKCFKLYAKSPLVVVKNSPNLKKESNFKKKRAEEAAAERDHAFADKASVNGNQAVAVREAEDAKLKIQALESEKVLFVHLLRFEINHLKQLHRIRSTG